MKKILLLLLISIGLNGQKNVFGENIENDKIMSKKQLVSLYDNGSKFNTKFEATVVDVCQMKGCWMRLDLGDNKKVLVNFKDYGFFVPDGFSPNGDGRNDTFFVPNIEVIFPNFTLEILNRYGTTLFKGDKSTPAWDGRNRSGMAPNGVYFYIIDYHKEGYEPIQGRLYLNR